MFRRSQGSWSRSLAQNRLLFAHQTWTGLFQLSPFYVLYWHLLNIQQIVQKHASTLNASCQTSLNFTCSFPNSLNGLKSRRARKKAMKRPMPTYLGPSEQYHYTPQTQPLNRSTVINSWICYEYHLPYASIFTWSLKSCHLLVHSSNHGGHSAAPKLCFPNTYQLETIHFLWCNLQNYHAGQSSPVALWIILCATSSWNLAIQLHLAHRPRHEFQQPSPSPSTVNLSLGLWSTERQTHLQPHQVPRPKVERASDLGNHSAQINYHSDSTVTYAMVPWRHPSWRDTWTLGELRKFQTGEYLFTCNKCFLNLSFDK